MELLVRIAFEKYKRNKLSETVAEGLQMLIDESLKPLDLCSQWQDFRDNVLWTEEVNDIFEANLSSIANIYKQYTMKRGFHIKFMNYRDVQDWFIYQAQLPFTDQDVSFFYGMSKMTVANEKKDKQQYDTLLFVELLEMIARSSIHAKMISEKMTETDLTEKIKIILD